MAGVFLKLSWTLWLMFCVSTRVNGSEENTTSLVASGPTVATLPSKHDLLLPGETFHVANHAAFVMLPEETKIRKSRPWIWYCITRFGEPNYPDYHEKWMHEQFVAAGIAVAGVDVGESFGSPQGQNVFDAFYEEMTVNRGFASKPFMFGKPASFMLKQHLTFALLVTAMQPVLLRIKVWAQTTSSEFWSYPVQQLPQS